MQGVQSRSVDSHVLTGLNVSYGIDGDGGSFFEAEGGGLEEVEEGSEGFEECG